MLFVGARASESAIFSAMSEVPQLDDMESSNLCDEGPKSQSRLTRNYLLSFASVLVLNSSINGGTAVTISYARNGLASGTSGWAKILLNDTGPLSPSSQ